MTPRRFARLRAILDRRQPDLTVFTDRVHKPHNLSAIVRTCDAVGVWAVHAVLPPGSGYAPTHDSASGAGRWVRVIRHPDRDAAFAALDAMGMQIVAAHPDAAAVDFRALDLTRPTAFLLGTERDGLDPAVLARADRTATIPMLGAVDSLNVSVAAAVLLYEAQRQRRAAGLYDRPRLDPETHRRTLFEWAHPKIAELCRRRGVAYPELSDDGEILGEVPRG